MLLFLLSNRTFCSPVSFVELMRPTTVNLSPRANQGTDEGEEELDSSPPLWEGWYYFVLVGPFNSHKKTRGEKFTNKKRTRNMILLRFICVFATREKSGSSFKVSLWHFLLTTESQPMITRWQSQLSREVPTSASNLDEAKTQFFFHLKRKRVGIKLEKSSKTRDLVISVLGCDFGPWKWLFNTVSSRAVVARDFDPINLFNQTTLNIMKS